MTEMTPSPYSSALGNHLRIQINDKHYSSDTLTKRGAFAGLKVGLLLRLTGVRIYICNIDKILAGITRNAFLFKPITLRVPILITSAAIGGIIGKGADSFERLTGSSEISDHIASAARLRYNIELSKNK